MLDPVVTETLNRVKPGEDHLLQHLVKRYDRGYEVYRGLIGRQQPSARGGRQGWQSRLRPKYGLQVIDTAMVNIIGGQPRFRLMPRRPEDTDKARQMQRVLDYFIREDHLADKQPAFVQQGLIKAVTAAKTGWSYDDQVRPIRRWHDTPMGRIEEEQDVRLVLRDGPTFEPWDMYDMWWDVSCRDDIQAAGYVVLRSWQSKDDLLKNAITEDNQDGQYENVPAALATGAGRDIGARPTTSSEINAGGARDRRKDAFEILEVWRKTPIGVTQTLICNRQVVLRHRLSPFWHGEYPVVLTQPRIDEFNTVGISLAELVDHMQEALWTLQNMRIDNMHLTVHRGFTYRESSVIDPAMIRDGFFPRFAWPVTDHDDIRPIDMQGLPREAYEEDNRLMSQLQLITGITPFVSGADMQGIDQNTATGVTALQDVASRLLRFMARQYAFKGYQRAGEQWCELVKQFMTDVISVRIDSQTDAGEPTYNWEEIDPQEVVGSFDLVVEGTDEALSRQQERGEAMGLLQAIAPFVQMPGFNPRPILEKVGRAFGFPVEQMWQQPPAPPPAGPGPGTSTPPGTPDQAPAGVGAGQGAQPTNGQLPADPGMMMRMMGAGTGAG